MVREKNSNTAVGEASQQSGRSPLANISATMQPSLSHNVQDDDDDYLDSIIEKTAHPEFINAKPLQNQVKRREPSIFLPKKTKHRSPSTQNPMYGSRQPTQSQTQDRSLSTQPVTGDIFSQPTQRRFQLPHSSLSGESKAALTMPQGQADQYLARTFQAPNTTAISRPTEAALPTIRPATKPVFKSIGSNTFFQPFQLAVPPKEVINLDESVKSDGEHDEFDPDAALAEQDNSFGAADPYMYVDSSKANENIKNLLEGAFDDDEDKSTTRLRRRAKKALRDGDEKEAKSLAAKLSALSVAKTNASTELSNVDTGGSVEEEQEDGTVDGLAVKLLPHQVQGIAWMIDKEIGIRKRNGVLPRGGILADDMGLGKTVQSITLILTNARPEAEAKPEYKGQKLPSKEVGKGTLVVAPLALIKQWEDEIKTKVLKSHALRVLVHHGPSRTKNPKELEKYDVVITTYQTLTSEHQGSNLEKPGGAQIGCFGVHWYRVILDEAHSIKNKSAKSTVAACALSSWYRWCLTGTPMQNNLDELQSLIKFLRIKPYCEMQNWKEQITGPMKNGRGGLAMKRLNFFLKAFMKRRTKDILKKEGALNFGGKPADGETPSGGMKIVKREVITVECDFDEIEQRFYDKLANRADERLKELTKEGAKTDYIGALVLLLRLRQACNHAQLVGMSMNKDKDALTTGASTDGMQTPRKYSSIQDDMDGLTALMGNVAIQAKNCDVCRVELSPLEAKNGHVRCTECEADLVAIKKESRKGKPNGEKRKKPRGHMHSRRVISDDEDENTEGEGEWIGKGPEEHIDLGKAGGTDDEDAEGGGETLGSTDSERSEDDDEDEEDSPPRARRRLKNMRKTTTALDDSNDESAEEQSSESDDNSDPDHSSTSASISQFPTSKSDIEPSTKIRKLLRILHAEAPQHKFIVFSQFTTMLDLIEPHLVSSKLRFVRYDGSMRPDAREASLASLRHDKKCRILLCSLKCGSLGLNLTAASRVVIIEPFWNPFVEEQAIDRVHRLNQTVDVRVFRLIIRDSVEMRILDLQQRKRELAAAAIEGGKAVGKLSMQDILSLFRHDAEHSMQHDKDDREMWAKFGSDQRLLGESSSGVGMDRFGSSNARTKGLKPGKERLFKEHDVFGRRW